MKIDFNELRAQAAAHSERLNSPLWAPSDAKDDSWVDWVASEAASASASPASAPRAQRTAREPPPDAWAPESQPRRDSLEGPPDDRVPESQPRMDSLERAVGTLTDAVNRRPAGSDGIPGWLEFAAGNPHTYDSPDPTRVGVFARIRPATYDRLRMIQHRVGLRTIAGAWEYLMRLGLAAAERLPAR